MWRALVLVFLLSMVGRKAWLKGLSLAENRTIPPLCYPMVYRIKRDFLLELEVVIKGGIKTIEAINCHFGHVDWVMIGREAYANPLLFAPFDRLFHLIICISMKNKKRKTQKNILFRYLLYYFVIYLM
ncbi:tRNA-dihydrouridine synthase [Candidatus Coxiella mudrowiae]|uniref:tRNA-dihydrouridine synthase n=1 Tax=Candidatus Coxiella mudrowiae TaxID=2054173 RepID=UPI000AB8FBF3|nr:tRNA-dihydrouridine synthase [Candidatus Coxiella mudrowiae]